MTRTSLRCTRLEQSGMTVGGSAERAFQSMVRLPDLDGVLWADKPGPVKRIAHWNECQRWLTDKQLANGNAGALPARSTRGLSRDTRNGVA